MYPGYKRVKNGDARSELDRRGSTSSSRHLVGRNYSGGARGGLQERAHLQTDRERAGGPRLPARCTAVPRQAESTEEQVFRVKNSWGCRPNSKYLLPSVAALSLTIGKHDIVS